MQRELQVAFAPALNFTRACLCEKECDRPGVTVEIFQAILRYLNYTANYTRFDYHQDIADIVASGRFDTAANLLYSREKFVDSLELSVPIDAESSHLYFPRTTTDFNYRVMLTQHAWFWLVIVLMYTARYALKNTYPQVFLFLPLAELFLFRNIQSLIKLYATQTRILLPLYTEVADITRDLRLGHAEAVLSDIHNSSSEVVAVALESGSFSVKNSGADCLEAVAVSGLGRARGQNVRPVITVQDKYYENELGCQKRQYLHSIRAMKIDFLTFIFPKSSALPRAWNGALKAISGGSGGSNLNKQLRRGYGMKAESRCEQEKMFEGEPISMRQTRFLFVILVLIYSATGFVLTFEKVIHRR